LWPNRVVGDIPSLAQDVSVPALDDISLPVPDRYTHADSVRGREIARSVYESILSRRLRYMHEPWREEGFGYQEFTDKQRVRYPAWLMRDGGGTCLDLVGEFLVDALLLAEHPQARQQRGGRRRQAEVTVAHSKNAALETVPRRAASPSGWTRMTARHHRQCPSSSNSSGAPH